MKKTRQWSLVWGALLLVVGTATVLAHCEIPCGIYGDETRFELLEEHIRTVEKSMKQIETLSAEKTINQNQLARWVSNKEEHAQKIQEIVTQYFLTQRIKPVAKTDTKNYAPYIEKVSLLHQMLVSAMKAKQSTDATHVEDLRRQLASFRKAYQGA